jgi:gas vesicle protein
MTTKNGSGFLGGLLFGAAIGVVTGLLTAPRSGRETRRILQKSARALPDLAEDLSVSVQFQADRISEVAVQRWDDTLTRLKEAIAAGLEATQTEYETLTQSPSRIREAIPRQPHS